MPWCKHKRCVVIVSILGYFVSDSQDLHAHINFQIKFYVQILHISICDTGDILNGSTNGECESVREMSYCLSPDVLEAMILHIFTIA